MRVTFLCEQESSQRNHRQLQKTYLHLLTRIRVIAELVVTKVTPQTVLTTPDTHLQKQIFFCKA